MSNENGKLFVVSGPSGAGKGTVISRVMEHRQELRFSVSATTRAMREGEVHGTHYYFVSREEFGAMADRGELLEHFQYSGNLYGTPSEAVRERVSSGGMMVLDVETNGASRIKELIPDSITIYLTPSTFAELERRLRNRGTESEAEINRRLSQAKTDSSYAGKFDYIIINDDVDEAVREFLAIIDGEGDYCRTGIRLGLIEHETE